MCLFGVWASPTHSACLIRDARAREWGTIPVLGGGVGENILTTIVPHRGWVRMEKSCVVLCASGRGQSGWDIRVACFTRYRMQTDRRVRSTACLRQYGCSWYPVNSTQRRELGRSTPGAFFGDACVHTYILVFGGGRCTWVPLISDFGFRVFRRDFGPTPFA